jgi:hypothetical protein
MLNEEQPTTGPSRTLALAAAGQLPGHRKK